MFGIMIPGIMIPGIVEAIIALKEVLLPIIKAVVVAVQSFCEELGLIEKNQSPVELGEKVLLAGEEGMTPEKFDNDYDRYMQAIQDFKIDPEKAKNISEKDALLASVGLMTCLIKEKAGIDIQPLLSLVKTSPDFMTSERMESYLQLARSVGGVAKIPEYFNGELKGSGRLAMENLLIQAEAKLTENKDLNENQLRDRIRNQCD